MAQSKSRALRRNNLTISQVGNETMLVQVTRRFNNRKMTKSRVLSFTNAKSIVKAI